MTVILSVLVLVISISLIYNFNTSTSLTGKAVDGYGGPTANEMNCMQDCVAIGCGAEDQECMVANSFGCGEKCGVETTAPEPEDEGEECMQDCISVGCDEYDVVCEGNNVDQCELECNMKGDAPDESEMDEEQLCISKCVGKIDPSIICGSSQEGETGNSVCQTCAEECVYLYSGPCLNDQELTEKENICAGNCEHCYGEPVMGPSGEGWECIVDISCEDASDEFGDDSGEGPGIGEEGWVNAEEDLGIGETIGNVFETIGNFFKDLFSSDE